MADVNHSAPAGSPPTASTGKAIGRLIELAIFGGLIAILYFSLFQGRSPAEMGLALLNVMAVVVGIGFLIFIHELGHFLAAKWCDVKVETFSVGFGRAIPGCSFRYGETLYKLAVFPIGGYVKMLGQADPGEHEEDADAAQSSPRSYMNKTVGQRLFIISAGVIMNLLFGLLAFVYIYMVGKNEPAPWFGTIEAASPADLAGLRFGSELLEVNEIQNPSYEDLFYASLLSSPNHTLIPLTFRTPNGQVVSTTVTPRKGEKDARPTIGVGFPMGLVLNRGERPGQVPALRGMAAAKAEFRAGDRIIGVRPAGSEAGFQELEHGWQLSHAEFRWRRDSLDLQVQRGDEILEFTIPPQLVRSFGLVMEAGPIVSISKSKVPPCAQELQVGDVIEAVNGNRDFDPVRIADLLADAADAGEDSTLAIRRGEQTFQLNIPAEQIRGVGTWNESAPNRGDSPMPIPSLGITFEVTPKVKRIEANSSAEAAGFRPGMTLLSYKIIDKENKISRKVDFGSDLAWPQLFHSLQFNDEIAGQAERILEARSDDGQILVAALEPVAVPGWYFTGRGLKTEIEMRMRTAGNLWEAMQLGFRDTWRFVARIYINLSGFITGSISYKLLAGPVQMAQATYAFAERGFNDLIHFLAMISINLAVVNFLPIPVLDGGHAVMLILEKIRGKPINEKIFAYATYAGLAFILGLMLFVTLLDLSKFTWWQRLFGG